MSLLTRLRDVVGAGHLLADPQLRAGYERDVTGRFGGPAAAVVRPAGAAQVVAVLRECDEHGVRLVPHGHLGGNVHVNVLGPEPDDERADEAVLALVAAYGGSMSAEHGVGVAKHARLHLSRNRDEIAAMRRLKAALDPRAIPNPGVVLPAEAR